MPDALKDRPGVQDQSITGAPAATALTSPRRMTLLTVSLSCIFVYLQVFVRPGTPRLASGDQAIYLHDATRMLNGEMIYRDYDHFTFPGTDLLYAALFKCFGVRAWIPQAMLVVLGATMTWLIIVVSQNVIGGMAAYLPALLFITLPFSSYLDATHHWYSLVASTAAIAIILKRRTHAKLVVAGALVGFATFFTQSMALLIVGFALFLAWERSLDGDNWSVLWKKEAALVVGFLTVICGCLAYFIRAAGAKNFLYYTVIFTAKYYPADWFNNWRVYLTGRPQLHAWATWFDLPAFALIHLVVPFVYIAFAMYALRLHKEQTSDLRRRLVLVNLAGVFLFLTVASAPAYSRLYAVSPPALITLVWFFQLVPNFSRSLLRSVWVTVLIMLMVRPLMMQIRWRAYLDLPTGRTVFFDRLLYEKCEWMSQRAQPFYDFFGDPLLAFTLRLRNVGRVPFLRPTDYTRPEEVADAIQAIDKFHVPFVSWYIGLDREKDAARHPEGNHLAPIRRYLLEHYHVAHTFTNGDQIWERNP